MRPCIAVADYFSPGQTFVNRHIDLLFGGGAFVIAGRLNDLRPTPDERFFKRRGRDRTLADRAMAPFVIPWNFITHGSQRLPFGSAEKDLRAFLESRKPDFILSEFGTHAITLAPTANALGIPIFTYFRGFDASSEIRHWRGQRAYRKVMPRLAGVFSVSQFLLDNLASKGIRHPNAHVIPSGVTTARVKPGQKTRLKCIAVGRFVEKKAPETTIRAFAGAARDVAGATLTMIGDGPRFAACQALVAELGLEGRVHLSGAMAHNELLQEVASAEIFLQHSVTARNKNTEGLPTAIQEALACGCAVVSTRHAGIPEAVEEGVTGWLVDEFDAAGYEARLAEALRLPQAQLAEMGRAARRKAEADFDNDMLLKKLENRISATLASL